MNVTETLLNVGGVFNLAFAIFHLLFWRIFGGCSRASWWFGTWQRRDGSCRRLTADIRARFVQQSHANHTMIWFGYM